MARIKKRDRDIEKNISPLYLEQLSYDYDIVMKDFKKNNPHIPVLDFNGDTLDFVQNKQDLTHIINTVKETLNIGAFKHESTHKI